MNKIQVDNHDFVFTPANLPLLIHGQDKTGASLFTITLAATLLAQDEKILFLSGYTMAREEFFKQIAEIPHKDSVLFFTQEELSDFIQAVSNHEILDERVVIVKNIELFPETIFDLVTASRKLIVSGDVSLSSYSDKIIERQYKSKVLFSLLKGQNIPSLEKYQGFLTSDTQTGIVTTLIV